jgi:hypothetical protein
MCGTVLHMQASACSKCVWGVCSGLGKWQWLIQLVAQVCRESVQRGGGRRSDRSSCRVYTSRPGTPLPGPSVVSFSLPPLQSCGQYGHCRGLATACSPQCSGSMYTLVFPINHRIYVYFLDMFEIRAPSWCPSGVFSCSDPIHFVGC